jgi:glycoside hydrolase-like protein
MRLLRPVPAIVVLLALAATPAAAKTIHFRGQAVDVPAGWPVYKLAENPRMCVRMDRRAVYLGRPGARQDCPSQAIGRRRAILIDPGAARVDRAGASALSTPAAENAASGSDEYTGLGFDACAAPSSRTMAAWEDSPYRAIGVYIGGLNRACSQPNLTTEWVSEQVVEGWHLIPTYVGLQAPTSACTSCAKLSPGLAIAQGIAAARDAVADAQSIGIGPGSPIYFDMEAYTRTSSATRATLTFLAAWTEQVHELGYTSGVYSSSASGIADLAGQVGEDYPLPDDLWFANWNGNRNALDPYVPADAWTAHQRIHQYRGGHDETWGGTTINIDNNYVEGATVGGTLVPPALPPLTVRNVRPEAGTVRLWVRCGWPEGESCPGRIILRTNARLPLRTRPGMPTKIVRVGVSHRTFRLAGGRSHIFRVALNSRGRPLLARRGFLKTQLLVAIPGARAMRAVELRRAR